MSKKGNGRNGAPDDFRIPLVRVVIIPNTDTDSESWLISSVSVLRPGEANEHASALMAPITVRKTNESRAICLATQIASSYIRRKFTDVAVAVLGNRIMALCVWDPTHVQRPILEQCKRLSLTFQSEAFK